MNGKGDKPRPITVPAGEYDRRWRLVFGGTKPKAGDRG